MAKKTMLTETWLKRFGFTKIGASYDLTLNNSGRVLSVIGIQVRLYDEGQNVFLCNVETVDDLQKVFVALRGKPVISVDGWQKV